MKGRPNYQVASLGSQARLAAYNLAFSSSTPFGSTYEEFEPEVMTISSAIQSFLVERSEKTKN
jgi:hypothetical protein